MPNHKTKTCWIVFDKGKVGTANQCIGLAQALGLEYVIKEISCVGIWKLLPPSIFFNALSGVKTVNGEYLTPPWPDYIIAAGRASVAPTAKIRELSQGKTKVIQLQNPKISPNKFDAVIAPNHDNISGPNVIVTTGALHQVREEKLKSEGAKFQASVSHLSKPLVAVLVGGSTKRYTISPTVLKELGQRLKECHEVTGASFAFLPSRRTEIESVKALEEITKELPSVAWDRKSDNPYMGYLHLADFIIATCDSVSMISEACYTGKPVYVFHVPGGSKSFNRFHELFQSKGYTRPFEGRLEKWDYEKLDDFSMVVEKLREIINE